MNAPAIAAADGAAPLQGGLTGLDHAVIAVYLAGMLAMGFWIARRQRSTEDFFVGGRNLPAWAVGISILASILSTITYLGMPGEMFRTGVQFLSRQALVPLVLLVVWFLWIPFFMRLNLTSAYEYLERRFDYPTRALAAVFCLLLLLGWMSVVVLTAAQAMSEIVRLDLPWFFGHNTSEFRDADMHALILSIGLFSVLYTTLGGLRAVVWTDVVQFFVLLAGAVVTMLIVARMTNSGPADWLAVSQAYKHEQVEWFSWDVRNRSTMTVIAVNMFFWYICTHGANQVALQRYFSVKSIWAARRSYLVSALANLALGLLLAGVGISLMYFLQHHDLPAKAALGSSVRGVRNLAQDSVFPQFISLYLPSGLRGLVMAALFAAAMSTIDSGANSISTIVTVDFARRLSPRALTQAEELRLARMLTAGLGLLVVFCTVLLYHVAKGSDIITLCQKGFNCFLGPLGGLFVLAMFGRRMTGRTVIPAVLFGEAVGILASYSEELFDQPFSTHLVVPTAWLSTVVSGFAFGLVSGSRPTREQRRWLWRAVVRGTGGD